MFNDSASAVGFLLLLGLLANSKFVGVDAAQSKMYNSTHLRKVYPTPRLAESVTVNLKGFDSIHSKTFAGFRKTSEVTLVNCDKLTELPLKLLTPLFKLDTFNASNCNLGKLQAGVFNYPKLSSFRLLFLASNNISTVNESALELPKLWVLDLSGNENLKLVANVFKGVSGLLTLLLRQVSLTQLDAKLGCFAGLESLSLLDLSRNQISALGKTSFDLDLYQLKRLVLSHNLIGQVHKLAFLPLISLTSLEMTYNRLKQVPAGIVYYVSSIAYSAGIDLGYNQLAKVDPNIFYCSRLYFLGLCGNYCPYICKDQNVCYNIEKMKSVWAKSAKPCVNNV